MCLCRFRGRENRRCQVIENARVKYEEPTVDEALAVLGFLAISHHVVAVDFQFTESRGRINTRHGYYLNGPATLADILWKS